jgi:hypothetical protein
MTTQYTKRLIVIVRADTSAAANAKVLQYVDTVKGDLTFTVPLQQVTVPGVVAAHVCGWTMTPAQFAELNTRLKEIEATLSNKIRVFDVSGLAPDQESALLDQKLTNLGLQRMAATP